MMKISENSEMLGYQGVLLLYGMTLEQKLTMKEISTNYRKETISRSWSYKLTHYFIVSVLVLKKAVFREQILCCYLSFTEDLLNNRVEEDRTNRH